MSFRAASFRPVEWCGGRAASSFLPALVHARFSVSAPRSRPALRSLEAAHPASVGATAGAGRSDSTARTSQEGRADPRVEPRCSGLGTRSHFAGAGSEWAASVCVGVQGRGQQRRDTTLANRNDVCSKRKQGGMVATSRGYHENSVRHFLPGLSVGRAC